MERRGGGGEKGAGGSSGPGTPSPCALEGSRKKPREPLSAVLGKPALPLDSETRHLVVFLPPPARSEAQYQPLFRLPVSA